MPISDEERRAKIQARLDKAAAMPVLRAMGFRVLACADGKATMDCDVTEAVANTSGTLHGGVIATLVDDCGTLAILSQDAEARAGVTTDLSVSYLKGTPLGGTVTAEGRCLRAGRTLAFVEVDVRNAAGDLCAQGRMTKFMR